jgi:hypothetical protein
MVFGHRPLVLLVLCAACASGVVGCRRDEPEKTSSAAPSSGAANSKQPDLLVFPDELRVADSTVNEFVTKAMTTCAADEYEAFRLLWSVRETPLPREEFEQGWHAVQTIKVQALEKVMLDADPSAGRTEPETVYALLAEVSLDPAQKIGQKEPQRHVVLMITRENEQWLLAQAPKPMRDWVKKKTATPGESEPSTIPGLKGD